MRRLVLLGGVVAAIVIVVFAVVRLRDDGGSKEAFCAQIRQIPNFRTIFDTYDATDPHAAKAELEQAVTRLRALQDAAPGGVRGDVKVVADVAEKLVGALGDIDPDDPLAGLQRLDDLQSDFDRVETAGNNVTEYTRTNCGIELGPPTSAG